MPREILEGFIEKYDNKINSTTIYELHEHFLYSKKFPEKKKNIDLLFGKRGNIRDEFKVIDLGPVEKSYENQKMEGRCFKIKRNPILCSAYYTWLPSAYNPSAILDPYQHTYNYLLYKLNTEKAIPKDIIKLENILKPKQIKELQLIESQSSRYSSISLT
jgi:hypothetical protein